MTKYRIIHAGYTAGYKCQIQMRVLWVFHIWTDLFCGAVSDLPDAFPSVEKAEEAIRRYHHLHHEALATFAQRNFVKEIHLS